MAFSFGNVGQSPFGAAGQTSSANSQAKTGPDLEDIQTEGIGFLSIAGESKIQLLPGSWPAENLPPPTSSLMSVASQKGLIAAAGPEAVIIATTDSIRKAFGTPRSGDNETRPFQPQLIIPMSMRISQVAFTADESLLVLSAETGGGLAVYDVQSLLEGSRSSSFEMSTNSLPLRALIPNPTPEKGELLAIVTTDGKLMMANLKEKNFVLGMNGQVLKDGVSCISWSTKGKQLVAGLGDGSAYQMTPDGIEKAIIPRPPTVDASHHVSSITWLENNIFLMIHTPSSFSPEAAPMSIFHVVTRQPPEYVFQRIADPATPFGLNRSPPHHFLLRLRDFPPNLQDLIIVASTASTDVGLFSRSKVPLASDKPADKITGLFTMTEMSDDSRRAQLSMTEEMTDTSPIGVVLDLSSREKVPRPIPSDDIDESPTPLPALMVLNTEGILASWWVIYTESIQQGTIYPGLIAAGGSQQSKQIAPTQQTSVFGSAAQTLGSIPPAFGTPSNPTSNFSAIKSATPAFGTPSAPGGNAPTTFGAASGLAKAPSPWGMPASASTLNTGNTFGTPAFGSTSTPTAQGVAFGSSALPGNRTSPWATGSVKPLGSAFGHTSGLSTSKPSTVFGASGTFGSGIGSAAGTSGGFASFANTNGFAAAGTNGNTQSIFGSKSGENVFSAPESSPGFEKDTSFGTVSSREGDKPLGLFGGQGFTLGSTFKPDVSARDDGPKPVPAAGSSFFGSGFGSALGEAQKAPIDASQDGNEADMEADETTIVADSEKQSHSAAQPSSATKQSPNSTTPTTTPEVLRFQSPALQAPSSNASLFGTSASLKGSAIALAADRPPTMSFGAPAAALEKKSEITSFWQSAITVEPTTEALKIKQEPRSDDEGKPSLRQIPEAPLPPDTTSKASYAAGESSVSSTELDAPLPPSWTPNATSKKSEPQSTENTLSHPESHSPLDPSRGPREETDDSADYVTEDESDRSRSQSLSGEEDREGSQGSSGVDLIKDFGPQPTSSANAGFTSKTSLGGMVNKSNKESAFTTNPNLHPGSGPRSLFGEIGSKTAPLLPPPKPLSPRSPSPIRTTIPGRLLRQDGSRSVSAPGIASQLLGPHNLSSSRPLPSVSSTTLQTSLEQGKSSERREAEFRARKEAEESQALIDVEDESIQRFLSQETIGTKKLPDFNAHEDYVSSHDKDGIPAQVEAVYRDINSMIDTLGINSCSLKSFIKGHSDPQDAHRLTRESLDEEDEWSMIQIKDLSNIIDENLSRQLEEGRIKDLVGKMEACLDLEKEMSKLRAKHDDIRSLLLSHSNPEHFAVAKSKPLSAEQSAQQHDLRRDFTKFQKLLSEAEEGLIMLRAHLASQGGKDGKFVAGPTVEAVLRTIMKMTTMAEKRSGDIDVLENQMRKLRFSSSTSNTSREGSPFATPNKSSMRNTGASGAYGLFYTPDTVHDTSHGLRNSITSPSYSFRGTPPRKKLSGFTAEEKLHIKAHSLRRKEITNKLKTSLQKSGTRVRPMDDE